jgi:ADP-ribosylglycohydrolase
MKKLLLLEDDAERIARFRGIVPELEPDWQVEIWNDAPSMLSGCEQHFDDVCLISLDHDLNPQPGSTDDPGTGREIVQLLVGHLPLCPVIIHSSNADAAWSMHTDLRFAGWPVERVGPIGENWIEKFWLPKARELISKSIPHQLFRKGNTHPQRMQRALISLEGLAIGDAVGEMLAYRHREAKQIIESGLSGGPWFHTDDTEMAISIVEVLKLYGYINQAALSRKFAWRFERDPDRGYGSMTRMQMNEIIRGGDWQKAALGAFGGQGSMGNGGAMRVAPLGAFFCDDLERVVHEAEASTQVTHTHSEGLAGAVAVAIAAAVAAQPSSSRNSNACKYLFDEVLAHTPESKVRRGLSLAAEIPPDTNAQEVARLLGNGSLVTAPDTVPYAVWCAAHHLDRFVDGLAFTISGGGDCDTNAAIVGGVIAVASGLGGIPQDWRDSKEPLPLR